MAEHTLKAIRARVNGEWDDPDLVEFGPMSDTLTDIIYILRGG